MKMKTKQNQFIIQSNRCTIYTYFIYCKHSYMLRGWIINCTRCMVHISKQKQLISHENYSKTANCLKKKITAIFYGYLEFFAVCTDVLRNPRLEKHCFREKAQLQALENTTQPLWVGRRSTRQCEIF
jgi:hypothetical protein